MASGSGQPPVAPGTTVQEFKIRVPKTMKKKYHVMRFHATLNVDFAKWSQVKMERENNMKEYRGMDEDQPKFGAGSEFGRDAREEARRKKFGITARRYKPDDQPWILKVGGKNGKKFKGTREGGVTENAAYYVFTHATDGAIEAYPLQEQYYFQPIQRYKTLSAEEAEQEFSRRNKVINFFSLMTRKRLRGEETEENDDPEEKKTKAGKAKELKISDMDEWMDSADDSSSSDGEDKDKDKDDSDSNSKKKKSKKTAAAEAAKKKKKKRDVDEEAVEESDDGDEEGRERDYISDSSESESDHEGKANKQLKSVAEEDALRKLLTSDEDSDEEKKEDSSDNEEKKKENEKPSKAEKAEAEKAAKKDSSSELSSDSDNDAPPKSSSKNGKRSALASGNSSRSSTPTPVQATSAASSKSSTSGTAAPAPKRPRFDPPGEGGVSEQAVRRYLARKPMTTTELLTKFKQRKSGVSSDRLVETMTQILKKINPVKQTIKGKMYLSIKP